MKMLLICFLLMLGCFYGCTPTVTPVTNTADISGVDFSKPMKRGEDCIGFFGDADIGEAARKAKISRIYYVGYKGNDCIVVFGN